MYVFSMITRLEGYVMPSLHTFFNCLDLKIDLFANLEANTLKIGNFTKLDVTNLIVSSFFQ